MALNNLMPGYGGGQVNILESILGINPQARTKAGRGTRKPVGFRSVLQQTAVPDEETPPMSAETPVINVTGQYEEPLPSNYNDLEDARMSMEDAPERKGMFGVKGTLRDVLGVIGDSFLVGSGRDRVYYPQRERERLGDAMTGFTGGEDEVRAAAERLAYLGHTDKAQELMDKYTQSQLRQSQLESLEANRQGLAADRAAGNFNDAYDRIGRLFGSEIARTNPALALEYADRIARSNGTTLEAMGITPDITPEQMQMLADSDMTVNQQRGLPVRQYNAETARMNATRPRPVRQPRSQTVLEYTQEIMNKDPQDRTPEEQQYLEKQLSSGRSRGSGRRSAPRSNRDTSGWSVRRN